MTKFSEKTSKNETATKKTGRKMAHPLAGHRLHHKGKKRRSIGESFGLLFALCALIGGVALFVSLGLDSFRPQLASALTRVAGRQIRLDGSVGLGLTWGKGLKLAVENVVVENPAWASRSSFARIGHLDIGIALLPLLEKRVEILSFNLNNADIQFEKGPSNKPNWVFEKKSKPEADQSKENTDVHQNLQDLSPQFKFVLKAKSAKIEKSRLTFLGADGKLTPVRAEKLEIMPREEGMEIHFVGVIGDMPVRMDLKGGDLDRVLADIWPFQADVQYGDFVAHLEGVVQDTAKSISISRSRIVSKDSNFSAVLKADLSGERPFIQGEVIGGFVSLSDLMPHDLRAEAWHETLPVINSNKTRKEEWFFNTDEINLSPLMSFDLQLDFGLNGLVVGLTKLDSVKGKILLKNGKLLISPLSGYLADSKVEGQIKADASIKPASYGFILNAHHIDLSQIALIAGTQGFLTGKVDMDADLVTQGNSLHEMASHANGIINLTGAGGTISGKALHNIEQALLSAIMPGQSSNDETGMNCLGVNLTIQDGLLRTDGIILDTPYASILGDGVSDLKTESIMFRFDTTVKAVGLSSPLPPLMIEGTLSGPRYHADAIAGAKSILSAISNKIADIKDGKILQPASERSSCNTLFQKRKGGAQGQPTPTPSESPLQATPPKKAKSGIEKLGQSIFKGLGAHILGAGQ